jgi:predicted nucleotidyltransferase
MSNTSINSLTPYQDINDVLMRLSQGMGVVLSKNLIGLYLFGSLSYGDFNSESSDIDLVAIVRKPLDTYELERIKQLHKTIGELSKKWLDRLECSYTPLSMFTEVLPPAEPRPYFGGAVFYEEAPYGNEWIINNYLLYKHAIPLIGVDIKKLINSIDIIEVQKACIRDLFQEWEPKMTDFEWLDNSNYQSYLVMNLCRILFTVMQGATATKAASAAWVKKEYGAQWQDLIENAEGWEYGKEMSCRDEAIQFIKFVIDTIKQTPLYLTFHHAT